MPLIHLIMCFYVVVYLNPINEQRSNLTKITYTSAYINDTTIEQKIFILSSKDSLIIKKKYHTIYYKNYFLVDSSNNSISIKELYKLDSNEIGELLRNESFWIRNAKVDKLKWKPVKKKIKNKDYSFPKILLYEKDSLTYFLVIYEADIYYPSEKKLFLKSLSSL